MEQRKFTHEEIEKITESIDGISKAEMPPFFYTRLQAKFEKRSAPANHFWMIIPNPAVSFVTLFLLVVLNIAVINHYIKTSTQEQSVTQQSSTGIQKFVQEYELSESSVYTDKTNK